MAGGFNGSGLYVRQYSWVSDANQGIPIDPTRHDTEDNGYASGLSNVICRDGQSTIIANIPWNNYQIKQLGAPTAANDATNLLSTAIAICGRLTPTSGVPINYGQVTGATTVYYTPYHGDRVPLNNGTVFVETPFTELNNILANSTAGNAGPAATAANSTYDLYVWNNNGVPTLTRSPAWTSATNRGTGTATAQQAMIRGITTNAVAITNGPAANMGTWVGTMITDASGTLTVVGPTAAEPPNGQALYTADDGPVLAAASGSAAAVANSFGGFVNKFRNPNMDVGQRGTAAITCAVSANPYTADGWIVQFLGAGGTAQVGVSGGPAGTGDGRTRNNLTLTGNTGVTQTSLVQRIESYIAAALSGQICTLSFWVYNNTGAAITPSFNVQHPSAFDNYTGTVVDVPTTSLQPVPPNVWTRVAYTFQAATQIYGLQVQLVFGGVLNANTKGVSVTEFDLRATPGLPIGLNSNPPPLEFRPIGIEWAYCQRYYWTSYIGAPGTAAVPGGQSMVANGTAAQNGSFLFPQVMRATPTMTCYSQNSGASGKAYDLTAAADIACPTSGGFSIAGVHALFTGASLTTGHVYLYYMTASSEL